MVQRGDSTSRRKVLGLAATSAVGLLAGCGGSGGGGGNSTNGGTPTEEVFEGTPPDTDRTFVSSLTTDPETINFNPWDRSGTQEHKMFLYGWLARLDRETSEFVPQLASDWSFEGDSARVTISDKHTWHDGDPVTAEDVWAKYRLDKEFETPMWEMIDTVETSGNDVVFGLPGDVNEDIFFRELFSRSEWISVKKDIFQEYVDRLEKAEAEDDFIARQEVRTDLTNLDLDPPIGWGPGKVVERNPNEIIFEVHDEHPHAPNWDKFRLDYYATRQSKVRAVLSNNLDYTAATPSKTAYQQIPDNYTEYNLPSYLGTSWAYNNDYEPFQDRRVRKAFSHLINWEEVRQNGGVPRHFRVPQPYPTGMFAPKDYQEQFLDDEFIDSLTYYGQEESHKERATELLQDAGYAKQNGRWVNSDGEQLSTTIHATSTISYWENMATNMANQLSNFGIEGEVESKPLIPFALETLVAGNYEMSLYVDGGAQPYPYFGYYWLFTGDGILPMENNHPTTFEVPMPVGDPDGSLEALDTEKQLEIMRTSETGSPTFNEALQKLAWAYNQYMAVFDQGTNVAPYFVDQEDWVTPSKDEITRVSGMIYWALHKGQIHAKPR